MMMTLFDALSAGTKAYLEWNSCILFLRYLKVVLGLGGRRCTLEL